MDHPILCSGYPEDHISFPSADNRTCDLQRATLRLYPPTMNSRMTNFDTLSRIPAAQFFFKFMKSALHAPLIGSLVITDLFR